MKLKIRIAILEAGFKYQSDFAEILGTSTSFVSNVVNGRRKLTWEEAKLWQTVLKCKPKLLKDITE